MGRRVLSASILVLILASLAPAATAGDRVGRYIVVLKDGADHRAVAADHARSGVEVEHLYGHALKGYSATMSATAATQIARDRRVRYVEADGIAHKVGTQANATWGLDRVDQRVLPLDSTYNYTATGAGVTAYIIDTGVSPHSDFAGRLYSGYDFVDDDSDSTDCDGHGTHVAGTVGGTTYGVAKQAALVGVRVLDCNGSGYWSDVIAGIDWVTRVHSAGAPAVANMSLGGGGSTAVDDAVKRSVADGVTYAVAAGNGNRAGQAQDACGYSPARVPEALTVGATNSSDTKASWSNYGTCLDLFAPGVAITSTVMGGGTESWSGTSMATPHVAGAAALYLEAVPSALPAEVAGAINSQATPDVVSSAGSGSPNRLLYSLLTVGTGTPPSNTAPNVAVTSPTGGTTVSGETVAVEASASDIDGTISKVDFFIDSSTVPFGSDLDGSNGWTATWDSTSVGDGSHEITAVATDDDGATASAVVTVTVSNPVGTSTVTLIEARPYKVKGWQKVDLAWTGATSTTVDVYRNGDLVIAATSNDGSVTDPINSKGGGSYTYYVCEARTTTCSNTLTASF